MAIRNIIVQCLSADDTQIAEVILAKSGADVSSGQVYMQGYAEDEDIKAMENQGLIVERVPDAAQVSMSWLDPNSAENAGANLLSDAGGAPSAIEEAGDDSQQVFLIQLKGPLRPEWKEKLDKCGVELTRNVPNFAFKGVLDPSRAAEVEALDFVVGVTEYSSSHTLRRLTIAQKQEKAQAKKKRSKKKPPQSMRIREIGVAALGGTAVSEMSDVEMASVHVFASSEPEAPEPEAESQRPYEIKCHLTDNIPVVAEAMKVDARVNGELQVGRNRIRFKCEENSPVLGELAAMPQISVVAPYEEPQLVNNYVRAAIGVEPEKKSAPPLPWNGDGVIVGVADSGVDETHPDLKDQLSTPVIFRVPSPNNSGDRVGHGTHVCGTIAGTGAASNGKLCGVAPGARLVVQKLLDDNDKVTGLPINLGELFQEAYDKGVRIHNNSWGNASKGLYSIDSFEVDEFVYEHPDFLVIFAAGNDGMQGKLPDDEPDYVLDQLGRIRYKSLFTPASAKNSMTVGACCSNRNDGPFKGKFWKDYQGKYSYKSPVISDEPICGKLNCMAAFSSRGPCDDARIKPDVVAPGSVILSTRSGHPAHAPRAPLEGVSYADKYEYMWGTSMAAPVVAAAAAIVREYFVKECDHQPSAALLKAALINGTVWIDSVAAVDEEVGEPNFHQGFGRIDLKTTLPLPDNASGFALRFVDVDRKTDQALNSQTAQRGAWRRTVKVEAGMPLRVTLTWTDKPAHGLQQNLNLAVSTPDNKKVLGNYKLSRPSYEKFDKSNNVEQVFIQDPLPGNYQIHVTAFNTPFENQGFSLVVAGHLKTDLLP